ncbi:MAG: UTP--glucose-1-phosphate uridylyltransferase [Parachlamydiaceae bacterium]|nr:UTP--glucose-1-phosphate uridylyltransferase [Parachlamydiaceae bacterium]
MIQKNFKNSLIEDKLAAIEPFVEKIIKAKTIDEKLQLASLNASVALFLSQNPDFKALMEKLDQKTTLVIKVLLALGQGTSLFKQIGIVDSKVDSLKHLLKPFLDVEHHYAFMGGLAGYYHEVIKLIEKNQKPLIFNSTSKLTPIPSLKKPPGLDLSVENKQTLLALRMGIESLPCIAEICPIGGAGDRLNLKDEITQEPLPAAILHMGGFSLLEGLIRDLQAQEYLYWKIYDKQLIIPLAMMTSDEKDNDAQISSVFQKNTYFGRTQESFRRFIQPLVPLITENGDFAVSKPLEVRLKPGGHGMLWKLAIENGIFEWFRFLGKEKMAIRQINNPIAAIDMALLAFLGLGCAHHKSFGFLSCERLPDTAEGMLVLRESKTETGFSYSISNIEYTDIKNIEKSSSHVEESYSKFPANTNILFADLNTMETLIKKLPLPGILINMKSKVSHLNEEGELNEVYAGRLECMMQNISDILIDQFPTKLNDDEANEKLQCFVAYGERQKTISVTKNPFIEGKPIAETPEGCFYDQILNCRKLLVDRCKMKLPGLISPEEFVVQGPPFIVRYHPALGPMYHVIAQKIKGGTLKPKCELILEISELKIEELNLDGSLQIFAKDILGHHDDKGVIHYSKQNGKCELMNVKVVNRGINWEAKNSFWEDKISYQEKLEIILNENAEFFACDVTFEGGQRIEVPAGERMEITMENGSVTRRTRKISEPTWFWNYEFDQNNAVLVTR